MVGVFSEEPIARCRHFLAVLAGYARFVERTISRVLSQGGKAKCGNVANSGRLVWQTMSASHLPCLLSFGQPLCKLDNTKLLLPQTGSIDGAIYLCSQMDFHNLLCFLSFDDISRFTKKHAINTMRCLHKIQ